MPYDFSSSPDAQLNEAASSPFLSAEARTAAAVELARRDEARRRAALPDNVDANLDAAATPVTPDPVLKPRTPVAQSEQGPPPTKWQELMADPRNFSLEEADSIAAESDPGIQGILEGAPNRYERFGREMNAMDARMGWERGHPAKEAPYPDLVPPGARSKQPPARPQGRVPRDPEDYRIKARRGVVGPRTDDGRPPRLAPEFADAEAAAEYYVRPRNPETGELMPSRADEAMMARGSVPVYTPDGDISYSLASDYDGPSGIADKMSPNAHRRAGSYVGHNIRTADGEVMEGVQIGADNRPVYDPLTGKPKTAAWESVVVRTPFGERSVLRLTDAARQAQAQRANQSAADRVAARIGGSAEDLLDPEARGRASRKAYEDDRQARRAFLANRNMLAGGSHNINSGNAGMFNQLAMMSPEEQIRQLQYALPGGDLLASVEARQLDQAARLAQDAVVGFVTASGRPDPMKVREEQQMDEWRAVAGEAADTVWTTGRTPEEVRAARVEEADRALRRKGVPGETRRRIITDIFGADAYSAGEVPPSAAPARTGIPPASTMLTPSGR